MTTPLDGRGRPVVPVGLRVLSLLYWLATAAGAVLAVGGFVADRHLSVVTPSMAPFTAVVGDDPSYLVGSVHGALWVEIITGFVAAVACGLCAAWIPRPSTNARTAAFVVGIVLILVVGVSLGAGSGPEVNTLVDASGGNPGLAAAYLHLLPGWYRLAAKLAEFGIIVGVAPTLLFILRGRYTDYYNAGRIDPTATFWASDKLNQG